jgi:hypothetical protein
MELPTKGSLSEVSVIEILKDASTSGLTGMLRLETGTVIKVVYLQNGTIAFASSNEKTDRLTEVLKRAGKLTPEQIEHAQARIKPNVSLGKTLVELGYISPKDLLWGARMQVEGILYQLLFWERGTYQVLEGPLPKEIVSLGLTIPQIIFAGIHQTKDRDWILKHIGSPEAVYVLTNSSEQKLDAYRLPVNEIISKINGKRSLEEMAQAAGIDTFEVCKTVAALQILELVEPQLNKPLQMALTEPKAEEEQLVPVVEEGATTNGDISLGEVMQMPTVEELQQKPPEQPSYVEEEPQEYIEPVQNTVVEDQPTEIAQELSDEATPFIERQAEADYDDFDEEQGGGWKKILLIAVLFLFVAVGAAFYFYRKAYTDKPPENTSKPPTVEKQTPTVSKSPENSPPVETETPTETENPTEAPVTSTTNQGEVVNSSALQLAAAGNLPEASKMWKSELSKQRNSLTIQVEIACQPKTIMEAINLFGASAPVYVVPLNFKGQPCYRVLYGTYKSAAQASKDLAALPSEFLQQPSPPKVIPIWKALQ